MKKMYFIYNPVAGKAAINKNLGKIIDAFTKADYQVTAYPTQKDGDAVGAAKYACQGDFEVIVCAGGDGTLSQVLCGVMDSENKLPIGYIPAGSTNDFADTLGIPKGIMNAVRWIIGGKPVRCDVGGFNDKYFSYIAAFGAFTNITYETSQRVKNVFGHAAYLANGAASLPKLHSVRMRVEYDDKIIEDDFIYGMVTNTASVAGLLSLKGFKLSDGLFEVTLVKKPKNPLHMERLFRTLLHIDGELSDEYIRYFRTDKIKFTALEKTPVSWTCDGEYGGNSKVNIISNNCRAVSFIRGKRKKS